MEIDIQSLHFTARPELEDFVREKVNTLTKYHNGIISSDVILRLDNAANGNKICEIKLAIPGTQLMSKKQADSFEKAAAEAVEALKQQLDKYHR